MKNRSVITQITLAGLLILVLIEADFAREGPSRRKVLIGFKDGTGQQAAESRGTLIRGRGGRVRRTYRFLPAVAAELSASQISRLKADPRVAYVEEDGLVHALDAEIDNSWGVKRIVQVVSMHPTKVPGSKWPSSTQVSIWITLTWRLPATSHL